MACTKNGRIRKLIKILKQPTRTRESPQPNMRRTMEVTVWGKDEKGAKVKTKTTITIVDKTYGRIDRRKVELDRLLAALGTPSRNPKTSGLKYEHTPKKSRMRKFSHKQTKRAEEKGPRKKKGKG